MLRGCLIASIRLNYAKGQNINSGTLRYGKGVLDALAQLMGCAEDAASRLQDPMLAQAAGKLCGFAAVSMSVFASGGSLDVEVLRRFINAYKLEYDAADRLKCKQERSTLYA